MGKLIRDEQEKLELVLSIPGHPKTQRYLRDYQNALFEELAFEHDVMHALKDQYFMSLREEARLLRAIQDKEDEKHEKHLRQLTMLKTPETKLSVSEQQQVLRDTLAKLEARREALLAEYESVKKEEEKKIAEIDQRWSKRQDEFQDNFLDKIKEKNIQVKDSSGNVVTFEKFADSVKKDFQQPSVQEVFGQKDLRKALAVAVMREGKLDPIAKKKMGVQYQAHNEIKMHKALCDKFIPSKIKAVRINNPELIRQYFDMAFLPQKGVCHVELNAKDMGEVLERYYRIDEYEQKLDACKTEIKEMKAKLDRCQAIAGETKPTSKKDFNPRS